MGKDQSCQWYSAGWCIKIRGTKCWWDASMDPTRWQLQWTTSETFLCHHTQHEEQGIGSSSFGPDPEICHHWDMQNLGGDSCDWCARMDSYGLFSRNRLGRWGGGGTGSNGGAGMCMEFAAGSGIAESFWVRIKWINKINNADVIVGACNRPCSQYSDSD